MFPSHLTSSDETHPSTIRHFFITYFTISTATSRTITQVTFADPWSRLPPPSRKPKTREAMNVWLEMNHRTSVRKRDRMRCRGSATPSRVWLGHQGNTDDRATPNRSVPNLPSEPPDRTLLLTEHHGSSVCKPLPDPSRQITDGSPSEVRSQTIGWSKKQGFRPAHPRPKHFIYKPVLYPLRRFEMTRKNIPFLIHTDTSVPL